MPVKRRTINLNVDSNILIATDADTGLATSDAGVQGETGAVFLHAKIPSDWSDLIVRLQVLSSSGDCDVSGLPLAGVIDMPLRSSVTVPGKLTLTLTGVSTDGVRRTAGCDSLYVAAQACPTDAVSEVYPLAFENLCNEVAGSVIHEITGSGAAKVTKIDNTTYDINVSGTGGDMLQSNYVSGTGLSNANKVDHAAYADRTAAVDSAAHADKADIATSASNAAAGSALEASINSKQAALNAGANGGVDLLLGTTVKSLKGNELTFSADDSSVTLGLNGALVTTGMIMYFAKTMLPPGWMYCDGRQLENTDYDALYKLIGTRYGIGTIGYMLLTPTFLTDNINFADDIVLKKYAAGIQTVAFFATGGTVFTGDELKITTASDYTFYCKDSQDREAVQYINIPDTTAPYLLGTSSFPLSDDLKLEVDESTLGENSTINLVKLAPGIQTVSYFANSGTTIGTADQTGYIFEDGTTMPRGIYTWYTKDAAGREATQYFNVVTEKTLTMYLTANYGSDYFRVPNLMGTINSLICPCIKL